MGKQSRRRRHAAKSRAEAASRGSGTAVGAADAGTGGAGKAGGDPALAGLDSPDAELRAQACVTAASLFDSTSKQATPADTAIALRLLRGGLAELAAARVMDPDQRVAMHAAGLLRNVTAFGGAKASEVLQRGVDLITPLMVRIVKLSGGVLSAGRAGAGEPEEGVAGASATNMILLAQCIATAANMCEASPIALERLAAGGDGRKELADGATVEAVAECALLAVDASEDDTEVEGQTWSRVRADLREASTQFLLTVTDSSEGIAQLMLSKMEMLRTIAKFAEEAPATVPLVCRVQICCTLCNLRSSCVGIALSDTGVAGEIGDRIDELTSIVLEVAVPCLASALDGDPVGALRDVATAVQDAVRAREEATRADEATATAARDVEGETEGEASNAADAVRGGSIEAHEVLRAATARAAAVQSQWQQGVHAQLIALEAFANLSGSADVGAEEEEWNDEGFDGREERAAAEDPAAATIFEGVAGSGALASANALLRSTITVLQGSDSEESLPAIASDRLAALCGRCLALLGNALHNMPRDVVGDPEQLWQIASQACQSLAPAMADLTVAQVEANAGSESDLAIGSALGLLQVLMRAGYEAVPGPDSVAALAAASRHCPPGTRERAVALIGQLGAAGGPDELREQLANAIVACLEDRSLPVATEAVNALIDMYSDDDHDEEFAKLDLLGACKSLYPDLTAKIRSQRSSVDVESLNRAKEVRYNLKMFIEYKEERLA